MPPRWKDPALPPLTEQEAERLVKLYEKAEADIQTELIRALLKGNKVEYLRGMITNVRAILKGLTDGARKWSSESIPRVYQDGLETGIKQIQVAGKVAKLPKGRILSGYGGIHQQAVKLLADNAFGRLEDVSKVIARRTDDIYRKMALEATRGSITGYQTYRQAAKSFVTQLESEGVTGFVDKSGRSWNMRRYADMVAQQTTAEAHWTGTDNRLMENGYDLVKMSTHTKPCPLCGPWEGKVLSLTGKTKGYPTLQEAMTWKDGKGVRHVKCRHAFGLWVPELQDDEEEPPRLSTAQVKASEIYQKAKTQEPIVTSDLQSIAKATDGKLAGLEFRLKTEESISRKLESRLLENPKASLEDVKISDGLRYTYQFTDTSYVRGTQSAIEDLSQKGYKLKNFKNTWASLDYRGLNTNWETPDGQVFEIQFHTMKSLEIKETVAHPIYEKMRVEPDPVRRRVFAEENRRAWSLVEPPAGATELRVSLG